MPYFARDGLRFHYRDIGTGRPVVLQHGLGGDLRQPLALLPPPPGVRLISLDCRGHGETQPLGEPSHLGFEHFADDLVALLDHLGIARAVLGGISMGAGVALNAALRHPERAGALILVRPAWLDGPMPEWPRAQFAAIAALLREHGAMGGCARYLSSQGYREAQQRSPATAASLLCQFERPRAAEAVAVLERLPADAPFRDLVALAGLEMPGLVLVNEHDPIHPLGLGRRLAAALPGAGMEQILSKAESPERHAAEASAAIARFLRALD